MTKLTSLALGAGLALASIGFAHADGTSVAGAWTLTVGAYDAPCTLTLTPDASGSAGTIASGADCPTGLNAVTTWKQAGNSVQLYAGSGTLVAWLKPKGDAYVGTRYSDDKKVALNR
jgi:Protease inhibitor Inh